MKKKITLVLALFATLTLAACGSKNKVVSTNAKITTTKKNETTIYHDRGSVDNTLPKIDLPDVVIRIPDNRTFNADEASISLGDNDYVETPAGSGSSEIVNGDRFLTATVNIGYKFDGWFLDGKLLSTELNYRCNEGEIDVIAKYSLLDEFKYLDFESTQTECVVTGLVCDDDDFIPSSIVIPEGVTKIGDYALECYDISFLTLPESLKEIGNYAFYESTLMRITFKAIPEIVGSSVTEDCYSLNEVILPAGYTDGDSFVSNALGRSYCDYVFSEDNSKYVFIDDYVFCYGYGEWYLVKYLGYDKDIVLPDSTSLISSYIINYNAFYYSGCESIVISDAVVYIDSCAFYYCEYLEKLTIGKNVSSIGNEAFNGCINLHTIYNYSQIDLEIGDSDNGYVAYYAKEIITNNTQESKIKTIGDFDYFVEDDGTVTILKYNGSDKNVTIPTFEGKDINLGDNLFYYNYELETVTLNEYVKSIGKEAFRGCVYLRSINLENVVSISSYAFYTCRGLKEVDLSSLENIGEYAFYCCHGLKDVELEKITYLSQYAFYSCEGLESVSLPKVEYIGKNAFKGCYKLRYISFPVVERIDSYAFSNCVNILQFILPSSLTTIDTNAFYECRPVEVVNYTSFSIYRLNSGNGYVGYNAYSIIKDIANSVIETEGNFITFTFSNKKYVAGLVDRTVKKVVIPNTIDEIKMAAFYGDQIEELEISNFNRVLAYYFYGNSYYYNSSYLPESLTKVVIGSDTTSLAKNCFTNCKYIKEIYYNGTIEDWCKMDFSSREYNPLCCGIDNIYFKVGNEYKILDTIEIPESITEIGNYQFAGFKIKKVIIPSSVTYIGSYAFYNCRNLTDIVMGSQVNEIGEYAFSNTLLKSVTLPNSVTIISNGLFENCSNLLVVRLGNNVTTINNKAFKNCRLLFDIIIPSSVNTLGDSVFMGCEQIESFNLKDTGITALTSYLFANCINLTEIEFPTELDSIESTTFDKCDKLQLTAYKNGYYYGTPENEYRWLIKARTSQIFDCTVHPKCEKVYPGAFSSCKNLKRIIIPSTCTDFAGCLKGLTNVEYIECPLYGTNNFAKTLFDLTSNADVPSKLKTVVINGATSNTLQSSAFKGCLYIQTVTITGSITKINDYAFENCSGLEAINIESALTTLGIAVFRSSGLKVFIAPSTLRNTGNCLFEKCTSLVTADFSAVTYEFQKNNTGTYLFSECTALSNVVLHSSFDYITDHAFYKCKALKTLTFPTYLDDIDEYAFAESGLESANFRWIYKIGRNAFEKTKLTSVSLPEVNTLGVCAFANCTNLTTVKFNYNGENNTTLYTINANVFEGCSLLSTLELPTNLQTIDNSAFKGCSSLTSVGLPSTLTKIYSNAFENCGLTSFITDKAITFGEKVFYNCKDLETVSITNGDAGFFFPSTTYTSAIYADYMFAGCSSLTSVTMPDTMATIRPYMFKDCTSLATYDFTNVKTIGYNAFENTGFVSLSLHSTLTAGQNAFKGCEKLETVVVNKVLANSGVFENCTALKSATLSEDTVEIVSSTFRGCTSLESFTFGDNVTTIDSYAFYESGIKTLDIQANIKEIGERAFFGCKIEELIIPSTASSVGSYAFAENKSLKKATLYLDYGNSSILYKCSALEEVVLAEGIKAIPSWMFGCCTSLESITFPSTLTTIGYASFYECTSLASITIPKNVTSIEGYAFNDCTSLKDVYNYSSLALVLNSTDNGYVAYYADAIHTSQINEEDVVTDANGYKFSKINDKYYLVGYTGESQMLVLPETFEYNENTINEYEIYPNAFFNNKQIRSITIKGNVTAIGEYAFGGCSNLLEVYNLSGLDLAIGSISNGYIAYYALQIHTSIDEESIYVEESNFIFMCYEEDGVNKGVVVGYNGTSIDITIPSSFTYNGTLIENISINAQAFEGCNFTSVTLSNGIIKIGSYAFRDCTSLTSIVVPSSVASCDVNPFTGCTSITKANIPSFMIKYVNRYDAGMSTLKEIVVNSGDKIDDYALSNLSITKVELADTITTIGANAFYRSDDFEEIVLPSGLTTLGASAFEQCGLKRVTIPETLTNIPAKAFYYNNGLRVVVLTNKNVVIYSNAFQKSNGTSTITRVYCKGTESDFANISIWLYTMNSKVYGTKYYYTEETPTTPGNYWHYDTDGRAVEYQYETAESLYHEMIEKMKEYLMNAATNSEYVYIGDDASLNIRQVDVDMFNMTYDAFINILTLENETDLLNRINSLVTSCNLKLGIEGTDRYYLATSSNSATINSYILKVDDKLKITCTQI